MASLNEFRGIGRLTSDPESKFTPSGVNVTKFSIAINRKFKTSDGVSREETLFLDCECWRGLAGIVAQYTRKGSQIFIGGNLKQDIWTDQNTGQKRSKIKLNVDNVQFLDSPKGNEHNHGNCSGTHPAPPGDRDFSDSPPMDEPPF